MADEGARDKISTSALAKLLGIPVQALFTALQDHGWITRQGESWLLTPKGEYEGGSYQSSKRYGRYVVWPTSLQNHQLVQSIEARQRISASGLRRYYPSLHPRQINRALAELGLQQHSILGWELTAFGKQMGGQQGESDNSGAFYVSWPHEIIDNPVIRRELSHLADELAFTSVEPETGEEPDLFDVPADAANNCGLDGHQLSSALETQVCNWLYLAQLAHAYKRNLPVDQLLKADFYLPAGSVYIDCWATEESADQLSDKLAKREVYREMGLRHIEVNESDIERLDEVLGRGLLAFGIRC